MTVQTTKNDPINRGEEGHSEFKNVIISTWLGIVDVVRTILMGQQQRVAS
jgi:hypothetical protein